MIGGVQAVHPARDGLKIFHRPAAVDIRAVLGERFGPIVNRSILVVLAFQMSGLRADVSNTGQEVAAQLPLKRQAPVLGVGSDELLIEHDGEERCRERHIVVGGASWKDIQALPPEEGVVEGTVCELHAVAERRAVIRVILRIQGWRVVKDRVAAANAGLAVPKRIPGEADAGREVIVIGVGHHATERAARAISLRLLVAVIEKPRQRVLVNLRPDARFVRGEIEGLVAIEFVLEELVGLEPNAEIQREARVHAPGITEIVTGLRTTTLLEFPAVLSEE